MSVNNGVISLVNDVMDIPITKRSNRSSHEVQIAVANKTKYSSP